MVENLFSSWIKDHFYPTAIVFSTYKSRNILSKNHLTPSEFLRPFGLFNEIVINQNYQSNRTLRNFRVDFYDADNYKPIPFNNFKPLTEQVLLDKYISPEWSLNEEVLSKENPDIYLSKLQSYSLPWYQAYENICFEFMRFFEYEQYQQPLLYIYICSIDDDVNAINFDKDLPLLISDGIYNRRMPRVIIILHDQLEQVSKSKSEEHMKRFQQKFGTYLLWNINSHEPNKDKPLDDIWRNYLHYIDSYNIKDDNIIRGEYISKDERVNFRTSLQKHMNTIVIKQIIEIMNLIEFELQQKKKGLKNTFLNFVKKQEQPEYSRTLKVYKFTDIESKAYLLGLLQFYFRNYEGALESFNCIYRDIKSKSQHHSHILQELMHICYFITNGEYKENEYLSPYNFFVRNHFYLRAVRSVFIIIKMFEQTQRFREITNVIAMAIKDIPNKEDKKISKTSECIYYLKPLLFEKISAYQLLNPVSFREFCKYIVFAGWQYNSTPFAKHSLHCLGQTYSFINQRNFSFVAFKDNINQEMGQLCRRETVDYPEGGLKFFKNSIELSKYTKGTIKTQYDEMTNCLYKILKAQENGETLGGNYNVYDLKVPEVDNSTLLILEEQDYIIAEDFKDNRTFDYKGWKKFYKYHIVPMKPVYLSLSVSDITSLRNLDDIILAKQNFSNFYSKRNFKGNINNKMYVRFTLHNPVDNAFFITNMKLICDFTTLNGDNSDNDIEYQNISMNLSKRSSAIIELYCKPLVPGTCIIKGVQITIDDVCVIKHYFNVKSVSKLYNYRVKRLSIADGRKSSVGRDSLTGGKQRGNNFNKKADITFEIKDNKADVTVDFPMGKSIQMFKNELLLMPIVITNNSDARIKRFCLFFDEEGTSLTSSSTTNENAKHNHSSNNSNNSSSILCDYIYKDIELTKNAECPGQNTATIYVPIIPKQEGVMFIKMLIKFEEDIPFKDNEVKRYIIKLTVNKSIEFDIEERLLKYTSNENNSDIKNTLFALDTMAYINGNEVLKDLQIGNVVYANKDFICKDENSGKWDIVSTDNNYNKLYHKFKYSKEINVNEKKSKMIKQKEIDMLLKETVFDFIPENIRSNTLQSHILHRLANLLVNNRLIFTWKCTNTKTSTEVSGIVFHEVTLQKPNESLKFLKSLLKNTCTVSSSITKLNDTTNVIALEFVLKRRSLTELKNIISYDIFVKNEDPEIKWYGLLSTSIENTHCKKGDKTDVIKLNFSCLCTKKGRFNINRIGIAFHKNDNKDIVLYNPPEQILVDIK